MYIISLWCAKREYFTKLIYKRKNFEIRNMVQNTYNTWISIIQQYDTYNLKVHVGQGLEIGLGTTDANKGIKLSWRRTSWGGNHSLESSTFLLLDHLDRKNLFLLLHQWYMAPTISCRTFHVSQVSPTVCPNTRLCHLPERIQVG